MATYDKLVYNIPPYQEGNLQDFEFDLDESFPVEDIDEITFQARSVPGDVALISKKLSLGEITVTSRAVKITFLPADTVGKYGKHAYEIDFVNASSQPFATIGGTFIINKQINQL